MLTLEQEFAKYRDLHKYEIIVACLIKCEKEGIYDEKLLKDYKESELSGKLRAFEVGDKLLARANRGEKKLYNRIYEICWNRLKYRINDKKAFRLSVDYGLS